MKQSTTQKIEKWLTNGECATVLICAYCNEPIKIGQPTVSDEWGDDGARMHIGCAAKDQDGQDLDRDMGDS